MQVVVLVNMELKVLLDRVELVLITSMELQEVVVVFVEIVAIQVQDMRDMQVVMVQVDVIVVDGDGGMVAKALTYQTQSVENKIQ